MPYWLDVFHASRFAARKMRTQLILYADQDETLWNDELMQRRRISPPGIAWQYGFQIPYRSRMLLAYDQNDTKENGKYFTLFNKLYGRILPYCRTQQNYALSSQWKTSRYY